MRAHEHFHKRSNERARLAKKHQNYETKPILKCNYRLILPMWNGDFGVKKQKPNKAKQSQIKPNKAIFKANLNPN